MGERLFLRLEGDALCGPETEVPAGTLRAFGVPAPLQQHVSSITFYRERFAPGEAAVERALPDGALHLMVHLGDAPGAAVAGASTAPTLVNFRGHVEGFSVALRPGAVAALLGAPAGEIGAGVVPLEALWGGAARALLARMAEAAGDEARAALLQSALLHRLRQADAGPRPAWQAARLITESGGRRPLREVADAIGVGERRLQQLFHADVGLTPRGFCRVARLHACLRALRGQPVPRWAELAADGGYYDQSHLANEFQALCGLPPSEFLARTVSGSSKTPNRGRAKVAASKERPCRHPPPP